MHRPNAEQMEQLSRMFKHSAKVREFFEEWRQRELDRLPNVLENTGVAQGRCQLLNELKRLIDDALQFAHQEARK